MYLRFLLSWFVAKSWFLIHWRVVGKPLVLLNKKMRVLDMLFDVGEVERGTLIEPGEGVW